MRSLKFAKCKYNTSVTMIVASGLSGKAIRTALCIQWCETRRYCVQLQLLPFARGRLKLNKTEDCYLVRHTAEFRTFSAPKDQTTCIFSGDIHRTQENNWQKVQADS